MWQRIWVPDPGLQTIEGDLPPEYNIHTYKSYNSIYCPQPDGSFEFVYEYKIARHKDRFEFFHFCPRCNLWIEGRPVETPEDTMGVMCGRKGHTENCRRCGVELNFSGAIS